MKLSPAITELLSKQCGRVIATPADCTLLALDIESATQERVSVNTLKRLLGFIDDERESRITTLNIIARYLGYEDWEKCCGLLLLMIVGGTHHQAHAWSYKTRVIYSATLFVTPSRQHQENKWMKWMLAFCCKSINFANEKEIKLYWQNKL